MRSLGFVLGVCILAVAGAAGRAQDIVRVEEDWDLVVDGVNPATCTPQVTTTMTPVANVAGIRYLFTLNVEAQPGLAAGGLQLALWDRTKPQRVAQQRIGTPLHYPGERVTWTQVLLLKRDTLTCAVIDGRSRSWGRFGGRQLAISAPTDLHNLNGYVSDVSFYGSGISGGVLAPTLVRSLVLRGVRRYARDGLVSEETRPEVVYYH